MLYTHCTAAACMLYLATAACLCVSVDTVPHSTIQCHICTDVLLVVMSTALAETACCCVSCVFSAVHCAQPVLIFRQVH
jgi:hypothetical protein